MSTVPDAQKMYLNVSHSFNYFFALVCRLLFFTIEIFIVGYFFSIDIGTYVCYNKYKNIRSIHGGD
jgi:hypothetical protein